MSDDDNAAPAAVTTLPEAKSGWSEQDRRTLIVTIAGGLAANLGTVILVGVAIALVHGTKESARLRELIVATVLAAFGLGLMVIGNGVRRGRLFGFVFRPSVLIVLGLKVAYGWLIFVMGSLILLEALLILIGLAADVK